MLVSNIYCPINHPLQFSYDPGHCWFYKFNPPLTIQQISKRVNYGQWLRYVVEETKAKDKRKRREKIIKYLKENVTKLEERSDRYKELLKGPQEHTPEPWRAGNSEEHFMSWAMSMSLVHNHLSAYGGYVGLLSNMVEMSDEELDKIYNKHLPRK